MNSKADHYQSGDEEKAFVILLAKVDGPLRLCANDREIFHNLQLNNTECQRDGYDISVVGDSHVASLQQIPLLVAVVVTIAIRIDGVKIRNRSHEQIGQDGECGQPEYDIEDFEDEQGPEVVGFFPANRLRDEDVGCCDDGGNGLPDMSAMYRWSLVGPCS